MIYNHLFEWMDLESMPQSFRRTLRDNLEVTNNPPFRFYYRFIEKEILDMVKTEKITGIVELGAGTAPLARDMAKKNILGNLLVTVTDINPDIEYYKSLEKKYPKNVRACLDSVNFLDLPSYPEGTLLVLSASFHHLEPKLRRQVLQKLLAGPNPFIIGESIRHNFLSLIGCLLFGWVFALLTPIFMIARPGFMRRAFWCWFTPFAALAFVWDGIVSVARCWTEKQWAQEVHDSPVIHKSLLSFALIHRAKGR